MSSNLRPFYDTENNLLAEVNLADLETRYPYFHTHEAVVVDYLRKQRRDSLIGFPIARKISFFDLDIQKIQSHFPSMFHDFVFEECDFSNLYLTGDFSLSTFKDCNLKHTHVGISGLNIEGAIGIGLLHTLGYCRRTAIAYKKDDDIFINLGCYHGTVEQAIEAVKQKYREANTFVRDKYIRSLEYIRHHLS